MTWYGQITGWGTSLPERVVTNRELEQRMDTSHEWIVRRTGIHARRIAGPEETTKTLAVAAGRAALERANLAPTDLDMIIVATSTPDHLIPAVANQVQDALGAETVPAFQLGAGCAGFIYALTTGHQFIASGASRRVLIVGAEVLSRFMDWEDRSTAVLFGDGAAAFVMEATTERCGLYSFALGSEGGLGHHLLVPAGGSAEPFGPDTFAHGRHYARMNGPQVFRFATRVIGTACRQAVARAGLGLTDIDWIVPHQANLRIIEAGARQLGLPLERFVVNIQDYANTASASVPLALIEALERGDIRPEQKLLLVAFGAGLTWGAAVLQMAPDGN